MAAVGFGFSPSDIVAFLKGLYQVFEVCRDSGKAPAEYDRAIEGVKAVQVALEQWESIQVQNQQPNVQAIKALAEAIETSEHLFESQVTKKYAKKLGSQAPRGRFHGLPTKVRWLAKGRSDVEKNIKARQAQGSALDWQIRALNTTQLTELWDLANRLINLVETTANDDSQQLSLLPAKIDHLEASLDSKILQSRDEHQDQVANLKSCTENARISIEGHVAESKSISLKQHLVLENLQNSIGHIQIQVDLLEKNTDRILSDVAGKLPQLLVQYEEMQRLRQSEATVSTSEDTNASLEANGSKMRLTWHRIPSGRSSRAQLSVHLKGRSFSERQTALFIALLSLWFEMLRELVWCLAAHLPDGHGYQEIPRPVSLILPDNIRFTDSLGREFNLSLNYFTHWSVLDAWAKAEFENCPGSQKVKAGKFIVFNVANPDRAINSSNWKKAVIPRARFKMAIIYDQVQVVRGRCIKCDKTKRDSNLMSCGDTNMTCSTCGLFCSSLGIHSLRPVHRTLSRLPENSHQESVPTARNLTERSKQAYRELERRLLEVLEDDITLDGFDMYESPPKVDGLRNTVDSEDGHVGEDAGIEDLLDDEVTTNDTEVNNQNDDQTEAFGPSRDTESTKRLEENEISHFSSIWIQRDTSLHDAALRRDGEKVSQLLKHGAVVNARTGRTGSALVASIIAGSRSVVRRLLDAEADPLLQLNGQHTAVSVAACYAKQGIFEDVLEAALRFSYENPDRYQEVIDHALYETVFSKRNLWVRFLCFVGANPTTEQSDRGSTLALAISNHDKDLARMLLAHVWDRQFLKATEVKKLLATMGGMDEKPPPGSWLDACCYSLTQGSAHMIERRINGRLAARKDHKFYFLAILRNALTDETTYHFWRKYEHEKNTSEIMDPVWT